MMENAKTDAYNVYDKRVDRSNSELSKLIIGQTMTINHGFPLQGYHFTWDESIDYTPEQQMEYEKMISDRYEVDGKYFADKYNMPVGERIRQTSPFDMGGEEPTDKDEDEKKQQKNFFD